MNVSLVTYGLLIVAVLFEALGTSYLEKADGLSHLPPIVVSLCFFAASFALGAYILKTMPIGVMYAVWCGAGIVLVGVIGFLFNKQHLDVPALIGMALIVAGVVVIYLCSKSVAS